MPLSCSNAACEHQKHPPAETAVAAADDDEDAAAEGCVAAGCVVAAALRRGVGQRRQLVAVGELERLGVQAEPQSRRPRAVVEHVPQVAAAAGARVISVRTMP